MTMRLNLPNFVRGMMLLSCYVAIYGTILRPQKAVGALAASDSAADSVYASWDPGDNGGMGWGGGWTFRNQSNTVLTTTNGSRGWFSGSSLDNNDTEGDIGSDFDINTPSSGSGRAWGVYSNATDHVYAIRPLDGALLVGQTISWFMDNGSIANTQVVGMRFLNIATDINSRVFEVRFVGGNGNYTVVDSVGQTLSSIPFTRQGLSIDYTLTGATTYSLKVTRLEDGISQTITGSNVIGAGTIAAIAFKNQLAGSNAISNGYLNSISVSPIPEASAAWLCSLTMLYLARSSRRRTA